LTGCGSVAFTDRDGTVHHVILGCGVVSVERDAAEPHGTVVEAESIGLTFSRLPEPAVTLGYARTMTFTVPDNFAYVRDPSALRREEPAEPEGAPRPPPVD
jgi:hypothetical protein